MRKLLCGLPLILILALTACAAREKPGLKAQQNPAPVAASAADLVVTVEGPSLYAVSGQSMDATTLTALLEEQDRVRPLSYVLVRGQITTQDLVYLAGLGQQLGYIILYENQGLKTLVLSR